MVSLFTFVVVALTLSLESDVLVNWHFTCRKCMRNSNYHVCRLHWIHTWRAVLPQKSSLFRNTNTPMSVSTQIEISVTRPWYFFKSWQKIILPVFQVVPFTSIFSSCRFRLIFMMSPFGYKQDNIAMSVSPTQSDLPVSRITLYELLKSSESQRHSLSLYYYWLVLMFRIQKNLVTSYNLWSTQINFFTCFKDFFLVGPRKIKN